MLTLEIDFSGLSGGAISALAVDQGYLGYFISERHNGPVGMFSSRDWVDQGSNPCGFACWIWIFIIASGMCERSFCIFRRIHVRLTWASQVAYESFFFPPLVTKTDTWIRTLLEQCLRLDKENSQTNDPEHTIVSSFLTDLIFRKNHERRAVLSEVTRNHH